MVSNVIIKQQLAIHYILAVKCERCSTIILTKAVQRNIEVDLQVFYYLKGSYISYIIKVLYSLQGASLQDCLGRCFKIQQLDGENTFFCSKYTIMLVHLLCATFILM